MQYDAKNPGEYLDALEHDWRKEKLEEIRAMIKLNGPDLKEEVEYKMLCYSKGKKSIFHLNAQKAYVSLYVGDIDKVANSKTLLREFDMGKGCIRIKKSIILSETKLAEFISKTIKLWKQGGNTDC
ncbi:MAG: DUF1801 domain-containing protein [Cyclobacteriaceae bacterium]